MCIWVGPILTSLRAGYKDHFLHNYWWCCNSYSKPFANNVYFANGSYFLLVKISTELFDSKTSLKVTSQLPITQFYFVFLKFSFCVFFLLHGLTVTMNLKLDVKIGPAHAHGNRQKVTHAFANATASNNIFHSEEEKHISIIVIIAFMTVLNEK